MPARLPVVPAPRRPARSFALSRALLLALSFALLVAAGPAFGTPLDYLPVGDPIESELRVLDVLGGRSGVDPYLLRHLHARPLTIAEIRPTAQHVNAASELVAPGDTTFAEPSLESAISNARILRWISRDVPRMVESGGELAPERLRQTSPRLATFFREGAGPPSRLDLSAGLEGRGDVSADTSAFASGSGMHARIAAQVDRWLAYSHIVIGQFDQARTFADPIAANTDVIAQTEESYLAYSGADGRWAAQFGRSRWHWGPGEEASLVLSRTSPPITGLALRASLPEYRLDFVSLSATLAGAAGEQLAAHRVEWQPRSGLRLGVTEAARYRAQGWRPLYLAGVVPYVIVQRLDVQDEPDSSRAVRNNVMVSFDAAWRVAEGTRVYGELLVDDLHSKTSDNPDKLAFQLGLEGVGSAFGRRVTWGTEYTRLSRFIYTSYFGRALEAQGRPLGFPTGPDARRLRVRSTVDLSADWQLIARAAQTDKGENDLSEPFVPGSPRPAVFEFEGVPETTRGLEAGARWWPASGVDVAVLAGWRRVTNLGHVRGASDESWSGALELRLVR